MDKERRPVLEAGSCNLCSGGALSKGHHLSMDYPYDEVVVVTGEGVGSVIRFNICNDCLDELAGEILSDG